MTDNELMQFINKLDEHRTLFFENLEKHKQEIMTSMDQLSDTLNSLRERILHLEHKPHKTCEVLKEHIKEHKNFDYTWKRGVLYALIGGVSSFIFAAITFYIVNNFGIN